ncbi:MAG TPA: helix-turn-helix domain-containing protein [Ktedonobacteraceae bacterium]|jgi:transposase
MLSPLTCRKSPTLRDGYTIALLLKAKGLPHHQIANCVGVCENTLRDYLRQYRDEGIEGLKRLEFYQPSSELLKHRESLEAYFKEHPPASLPQAAAMIEQLTGIKRSTKQVGVFLKKLGLKRLKTYAVPAKTDSDVQEAFKKKNWSHA